MEQPTPKVAFCNSGKNTSFNMFICMTLELKCIGYSDAVETML